MKCCSSLSPLPVICSIALPQEPIEGFGDEGKSWPACSHQWGLKAGGVLQVACTATAFSKHSLWMSSTRACLANSKSTGASSGAVFRGRWGKGEAEERCLHSHQTSTLFSCPIRKITCLKVILNYPLKEVREITAWKKNKVLEAYKAGHELSHPRSSPV